MEIKKTSIIENGLIWFGAAISIAEIQTGTYFAPLGFSKGIITIIIGQVIGGIILFIAGIIGGKSRHSSMETVKISFGKKGSLLFSTLNLLQLVCWTAIMIYDGALAANSIIHIYSWIWCIIIGILIIIWISVGMSNLNKINTFAVLILFILTLILFKIIFFDNRIAVTITGQYMSFGAAIELSATMPLSWLPLISDYTKNAKEPIKATAISVIIFGIVSCWMYIIGMGATIYTNEYDIAQIMVRYGLGIVGLLIIIFSTVTTTFLDAYSAGVSSESIFSKINGKYVAIGTTIVGIVGAIVYPMDNISNFLYLIGSIFTPMIAIQIADIFILKKNTNKDAVNILNIIIWISGFILYRFLINLNTAIGYTLPDIILTIILCILIEKLTNFIHKKYN